MAKLPRIFQKIFASNASNNGVFGSAQAGTFVLSNDPVTIQGLTAWLNGWADAIISGQKLPTLEEMQGITFVLTSQLAYLFQEGIPEYDASTTYFINSLVKDVSTLQLYASKIDNNTGHALSVVADWLYLGDLNKMISADNVNVTAVGNVGGGEDDLITYALPANRLAVAGRAVKISASGIAANNANAKTVKLYFGSAVLLTQALTVSQAGVWKINAEVIWTGASAQYYNAGLVQGGTTTLTNNTNGTATQTDTAAITIKCTGTATADNDIIQKSLIVEFIA